MLVVKKVRSVGEGAKRRCTCTSGGEAALRIQTQDDEETKKSTLLFIRTCQARRLIPKQVDPPKHQTSPTLTKKENRTLALTASWERVHGDQAPLDRIVMDVM